MSKEKFEFPNADGDALAALLELPASTPRAFVLFAHCFTCGKDVVAASRLSRALNARGFGVVRFDFTGLGSSQGDFANTNFSSNVADLVRAAAHMREHLGAPQILVGHSLGGSAVLAAAADVPEVRGVVTIGAPSDPGHVAHLLGDSVDTIAADGEAEVSLAGRSFRIKKQFLDDLGGQRLTDRIKRMGKPLLVMHSPRDTYVAVDEARKIYAAAKHPKSFLSLDDADHLLTRAADSAYVAETVAAWASRYLDAAPPAPMPDPSLPAGAVRVSESGDGFAQLVVTNEHVLAADEPRSVGGTDTGLAPYELLLAALGACTSMTMRLYARRKGLAVENIAVEMSHAKIHASDCEHCETADGRLDRIDRTITFDGELSAPERARLLEIADMCPVHRTLHAEVDVVTRDGGA